MTYVPSRVAYNAIVRKINHMMEAKWQPGESRRFVVVDQFLHQDLEKVFWDYRKAGFDVYFMHGPDPTEKGANWGKRKLKLYFEFGRPKEKVKAVLPLFVAGKSS